VAGRAGVVVGVGFGVAIGSADAAGPEAVGLGHGCCGWSVQRAAGP
jgi:hypothetical protein